MSTLGIYIQIPFCASKCSFCNFSSHVAGAAIVDGYCGAVVEEIARLPVLYGALGKGQELFRLPADTLYIGGGTPPLLGAERLEIVLKAVRTRFRLRAPVEFTLEVTPGSADEPFLRHAQGLGIN